MKNHLKTLDVEISLMMEMFLEKLDVGFVLIQFEIFYYYHLFYVQFL